MKDRVWIFIGYSSADEEKVEEIYGRLSAAGFRPWAHGRDLLPGDDPSARVHAAVRSADFFLACLSNNSVGESGEPEHVLRAQLELHLQEMHAKAFLIPPRLEECRVLDSLHELERVDLFTEDGWPRLLKLIETVIGRRGEVEDAWEDLFSEADDPYADVPEMFEVPDPEGEGDEGVDGPADRYSVSSWVADLRKLLSGRREASLFHLGGVEEYVEMNLEEAGDRQAAKHAFDEALEKLVHTWQPSELDEYDVTILLDLIRVFTPPKGFVKVITFIHWLKLFADDTAGRANGAFRSALGALESYYGVAPKPPEDSSPAYKTYIDLLQEELLNPPNSGYAAKRLIELKVLEIRSGEIKRFIERNPASLREIVNLLLNPNHRSSAEETLTVVFTYCLDIGEDAIQEFERAVMQCGWEIEDANEDEGPTYINYRDEALRLKLTPDAVSKYHQMRWRRAQRAGFDRINQLANV